MTNLTKEMLAKGEQGLKRKCDSEDDSQTSESEQAQRMSVFSISDSQKTPRSARCSEKFACPFAKYDAERWGQIETCGTWSNRQISTVIRHHILEKHCDLNKKFDADDPRRIDQSAFDRLHKWKQSVRLEYRKAKELWRTAYVILFDIQTPQVFLIPSPYFSNKLSKGTAGEPHTQVSVLDDCISASSDAWQIYSNFELCTSRKEIEKNYIHEQFNQQLRKLEALRDLKLRQVEQKYIKDLQSNKKSSSTLAYESTHSFLNESNTLTASTTPSLTAKQELSEVPLSFGSSNDPPITEWVPWKWENTECDNINLWGPSWPSTTSSNMCWTTSGEGELDFMSCDENSMPFSVAKSQTQEEASQFHAYDSEFMDNCSKVAWLTGMGHKPIDWNIEPYDTM